MITQKEFQMEEAIKRWNIAFIFLFIILASVFLFSLTPHDWYLFQRFGLGEVIIFILAVARLIRLLCYDNITLFLRELFLDVTTVKQVEGGIEHYERVPSENSFKATVSKLLNCPWCVGIWIALGLFWLYSVFPAVYLLFILLAISQVAGMIQLGTNLVGWNAEYKKVKTEKLQS